MSVTIGSRRRGDRGRDGAESIYVGRPSALGNPHPVGRTCPICGVVHSREGAVAFYDCWLRLRLESDTRQRRAFDVLLRALAEGRDVALICWCRSEAHGETGPACHADVIRRLLTERAAGARGGVAMDREATRAAIGRLRARTLTYGQVEDALFDLAEREGLHDGAPDDPDPEQCGCAICRHVVPLLHELAGREREREL